jgi:NAD(P)-dependent dehydrogenase (short-subunit alcohol dehydrogenase family)
MMLGPDIAAVVTRGASGLGAQTARRLAAAGVRVAIFDRDATRGVETAAEIDALFFETDVTDEQSVADALSSARTGQGVARLVVNCAGIAPAARTVDREGQPHDAGMFASVIAVNLTGTFNVASQAAAAMAGLDVLGPDGERGVIVNTASVAAYEGQIGQIAYAASKGAVAAMTLPMARDLAKSGIRAAAIAPGLFLTPMLEALPEEAQASLGTQVPFPARLGRPEEFAGLVVHIAENAMLNGCVIRLDGAIRMGPR